MQRVRFDSTTLCPPEAYLPRVGLIIRSLPGLDDEGGSRNLEIPAEEVRKLVPRYSVTVPNRQRRVVRSDVIGIAYPQSSITVPHMVEDEVWNLPATLPNYFSEPDEATGLLRVYRLPERYQLWDLVTSQPGGTGADRAPDDWLVSSCVDLTAMTLCSQRITYKTIEYSYKLNEANFPLREQVATAILALFGRWERSCTANST